MDVKECIRHNIVKNVWPANSNIIILSGHHTSEEGKLLATFSAFPGLISKHLEDLKNELGTVIEGYSFSHVPISTVPTGQDSKGNIQYSLAGLSVDNLKSGFRNIINSEEHNILIFATCFSKKSEINCFIDACGLYPVLFLSAEMRLVTGKQNFKLDKQQSSILEKMSKVRNISC